MRRLVLLNSLFAFCLIIRHMIVEISYQQYILNMFHIKLNMFFITWSVLPQITEMTNKIHFIGHSRFNFKTRCSRYLCLIYDSAKTHSSQYLQAFVNENLNIATFHTVYNNFLYNNFFATWVVFSILKYNNSM